MPDKPLKLLKASYHVRAIRECKAWDTYPDDWTLEQRQAIAERQKKYRSRLGIPEPDASRAQVRPAWAGEAAR